MAKNEVKGDPSDIDEKGEKMEETVLVRNGDEVGEVEGNEANKGEIDLDQAPNDEKSSSDEQEDVIEELRRKMDEEKSRAEENYQRFLRSQADFENYRKRMVKEKEELMKYGVKPLMEKLLPVVDNLERAIQSARGEGASVDSFIQGIEMVHRQLLEAMKSEGAIPLEPLGTPFDPHYHQAIAQEETSGEKGIVLEEYQKGYLLKDKLLRPAMVKVSS